MEKRKYKISIIISTYNRANYLKEAINSVLMQNYKNIEIIVIDDCSNDNTKETVESFSSDKIFYHRNEVNKGCGISRKNGLEKYATGDYIIFLDDDDKFIDPNYFTKGIKLYKKHKDLSIVCGGCQVKDIINNTVTIKQFDYKETVENKEFFLNFGNEKYPKPIISVAIIKREALEKTNYHDMKILNDTTIFLRVLLYGNMGFVNENVIEYLVHGNNISFNCKTDFIIDNLDEKIKIYRKLEKEKIFKLTKEQKENWLKQQLDITIIYFINGSKPNVYNFYKIIKWYKKNVGNNKNIKQFIKLYIKSRKRKESFI